MYGRTLSPTGVSVVGSYLSMCIQNSLLRCLAERCKDREAALRTNLQSDWLTKRCQKLRSLMSALHRGMVGRNPSSMRVLQWKEAIKRMGVTKKSLLRAGAI